MKRYRAQSIQIDTRRPNIDPWINIEVQEVEQDENGKVINLLERTHYVHRRLSQVIMDMVMLMDPVTQTNAPVSTAGVAMAIEALTVKWLHQDILNTDIVDGLLVKKQDN